MYFLYIVENTANKLYIGISKDPETRLQSHNRMKGPDWTQGKGPWKLIHTESFPTKIDALKKEKYLKSLKAGQRIKQLLNMGP